MDDLAELELSSLSSARAITGVAIPAVLFNAAPPLVIAVQTALVGRYASTTALAAFAAVGTCVAFAARAANFLVDGVSSKVGAAVGQRAWGQLASDVRLSVRWSLLLGGAAVPLLLAARMPLLSWAVGLSADVQQVAASYWVLRSATIPLQLLCMAGAGILQGFGRVRVNAGLTSGAALLEMAGSAAVLAGGAGASSSGSLLALGCVTATCNALLAAASLACVVAMPPPEAQGRVRLLQGVFGLGGGSDDAATTQQPLLAGDAEQAPAAAAAEPGSPGSSGLHRRAPADAEQQGAVGAMGAVAAAQPPGSGGSRRAWLDAATRRFLKDGLDMFVRTLALQLTFFLALAAAARLGTVAVAAHSIVGQGWVLVSYAVDGFAAAAIVLGSRLAGAGSGPGASPARRAAAQRHMRRLTARVLWAGGVSGTAAGLAFFAGRHRMPAWFTADAAVVEALRSGGVWAVLAASQPLNGCLFVADGLMYSTRAFSYVRNMMLLGLLLVFCPALALQQWLAPSLARIWAAKAALNVWRLAGALYLVYCRFLPGFASSGADGSSGEEA